MSPVRPTDTDESEDYYMDGPSLVFTAAFHLKRGFCCGNGCRHCPYGDETLEETTKSPE